MPKYILDPCVEDDVGMLKKRERVYCAKALLDTTAESKSTPRWHAAPPGWLRPN